MSTSQAQLKTLFDRRRWILPALVITGTLLVAVNLMLAWVLPRTLGQNYFALLLIAIGAVYAGAAAIKDGGTVVAVEVAFFAGLIVVAILGVTQSVWWLAAGYFAHGLWDLIHIDRNHSKLFVTHRLPFWYPPVCVIYDWMASASLIVVAAGAIR